MIIAQHHIKGTAEHRLSSMIRPDPDYVPVCAWPADCMVQWGHGIIPDTPFFEAFPPGTFIRGEGETIAEAERKAFEQFDREGQCRHVWGRYRAQTKTTYLNGAGWCRKCGAFRGSMFPEVVILGHWRKPLSRSERDWLASLENDHEMNAIMARKYPEREGERRKMQRVLRLRLNLYGVNEGAAA